MPAPDLDTTRFDRLSDEEVLDRIGSLLALAVGRLVEQDRLRALPAAPADALFDATSLVTDPMEQRILRWLAGANPASAREIAAALGLAGGVISPRVARLCAAGLCRVVNDGRPTRYALRTEFSAN
ncbi:MAG: helix-turn-helix transcriptional regulator [Opitutaceae bacterium]|nr:helix-turn-helix transcriptional regulator [Opitutaceae bacterium]